MTEHPLPPGLTEFIRTGLPSYEAAVFLVVLSRNPSRTWTVAEVAKELGEGAVAEEEIRRFMAHFERLGFVRTGEGGSFVLAPSSEERWRTLAELREAYERRPVTLVRVVGLHTSARLRAFSEAFDIKRRPDGDR